MKKSKNVENKFEFSVVLADGDEVKINSEINGATGGDVIQALAQGVVALLVHLDENVEADAKTIASILGATVEEELERVQKGLQE